MSERADAYVDLESDLIRGAGLTDALCLISDGLHDEDPEASSAIYAISNSLADTIKAAEAKRIILHGPTERA
jgi:hypothetical protein